MNKQLFSSIIGVSIILVHVGMILWILNFIATDEDSETNVLEIVIPFTITYAIGVVKWVIDTQGKITTQEKVGPVYVLIVGIISLATLVSLPIGLYRYAFDVSFSGSALNWYFSGVEAGFGALFSLVFSDMFSRDASNPDTT